MRLAVIIYIAIFIAALVGEVKCIIKFVRCDFNAPYKKEIIYGVGVCTGAGAVIGYLNINEN